jgi:hypothetical protein
MGKKKLGQKLQTWVEARKQHRLSHVHVQMARELGLNPKKLGKIDNHDQEPWKLPLPQFIEHVYLKGFGRQRPAVVLSIEDRARLEDKKKAARRAAKVDAAEGGRAHGEHVAEAAGAHGREISAPPSTTSLDCRPAAKTDEAPVLVDPNAKKDPSTLLPAPPQAVNDVANDPSKPTDLALSVGDDLVLKQIGQTNK